MCVQPSNTYLLKKYGGHCLSVFCFYHEVGECGFNPIILFCMDGGRTCGEASVFFLHLVMLSILQVLRCGMLVRKSNDEISAMTKKQENEKMKEKQLKILIC